MYLAHRYRIAAPIATVLAVMLTLGLWLPGSKPTGRERPIRRAARSGWSARSVGSAVWVVPDQEVGVTTPGAGAGHDGVGSLDDAQPVRLTARPVLAPWSFVLVRYVNPPSSALHDAAPGPHRGRAPPARLS